MELEWAQMIAEGDELCPQPVDECRPFIGHPGCRQIDDVHSSPLRREGLQRIESQDRRGHPRKFPVHDFRQLPRLGHIDPVIDERHRDMEVSILPSRPPHPSQGRLQRTIPPRPTVQREVELEVGFAGTHRALLAHRSAHLIGHVSSMHIREHYAHLFRSLPWNHMPCFSHTRMCCCGYGCKDSPFCTKKTIFAYATLSLREMRDAYKAFIHGSQAIIPQGVEEIDAFAFWKCSDLTSIEIPESVRKIGENAFDGCSGLTSIKIPNSVTELGDGVFQHCSGLTSIQIPNSITKIPDNAFWGCTGLTSIEIPDSVTEFGKFAFWGCSGLTSIDIPRDETRISQGAFEGCSELLSISIPDSVTDIGDYAFRRCTRLSNIILPQNVTRIGRSAFERCNITSIEIPESVEEIGFSAFGYCSKLHFIRIPDSVKVIDSFAFSSCTALTQIAIPQSITTINEFTFSRCDGLTHVVIPDNVSEIWKHAFFGCTRLSSIELPQGVKIWPHVFHDCTALKEIKLKETDPEKIEAALYISGLHDITKISVFVPCGSEVAYQNNEFFSMFKGIVPY